MWFPQTSGVCGTCGTQRNFQEQKHATFGTSVASQTLCSFVFCRAKFWKMFKLLSEIRAIVDVKV